jgi:hypothetical protein
VHLKGCQLVHQKDFPLVDSKVLLKEIR